LRSNRATIAQRGRVEVATLAQVACDVAELTRAAAELPWSGWLTSA
ncbi:MAG: hypothetical protein H0W96_04020, partial [Solirubrobacterales bacterium]|nr:hypothetical protein [Solirubrobacterales bacterium]